METLTEETEKRRTDSNREKGKIDREHKEEKDTNSNREKWKH